ncbi:hypothetical protein J3R30DRAFT_3866162 [Lentinula aciculospora]|uniref:F-box domain-containing protein n=1 Tax=Lentinula aciculospora TaxID=153920 RepID=A0A9W9AEX7_9AGAR|nr:hypothetical protein J3R30DRAFT_3866162 [Lentinula aciculospora]
MHRISRPPHRQSNLKLRDIWVWASPVRSSGLRILEPIPVELYLMIFDYIKPRKDSYEYERTILKRMNDLRNMSLVCRYFCAEILPWLFESLVFHPNLPKGDTGRNSMSYIPFCRSLNQGEILAKSLALQVKQCVIRDWLDVLNANAAAAKAFLNIHMSALPYMTNLHTISLSRTRLVPSLLAHIRRLPNLQSLTINCCDFTEILPKHAQKYASRSKLKSFRLFLGDKEEDTVHPPDDLVLKEFLPLVMKLSKLGTDSWLFMNALFSSDALPSTLETLEILSVRDLSILCEYLYRLPALASLTIDCGHLATENPISLSHLTSLRHLTCLLRLNFAGSHELDSLTLLASDTKNISLALVNKAWPRVGRLIELCLPCMLVISIFLDPNSFLAGIRLERLRQLTVISDDPFLDRREMDHSQGSIGVPAKKGGMMIPAYLEVLMKKIEFPSLDCISFRDGKNKDCIWKRKDLGNEWKPVEQEEY